MKRIATRQIALGQPARAANDIRRQGYVTNALIVRHGTYERAMSALNNPQREGHGG